MKYKYLSVGNDAKTIKGQKKGHITAILYLAPAEEAGGETVCKFSTKGCRRVCYYTAGRGAFDIVKQARIRKTRAFQADPQGFVKDLKEDISNFLLEARAKDMIPSVRLNGTSDILWEELGIMECFPNLQFYDYTKYPPVLRRNLPSNYHLTFSFSEKPTSTNWALGWRARGVNTAMVFLVNKKQTLPWEWPLFKGAVPTPVIDGDEHDLRFLDPKRVIVGLKVKGKARTDSGDGFVQNFTI